VRKEKAAVDTIEGEARPVPVNVRTGCICPNAGRPIDGMIFVDPCCKVHYAELEISALIAMVKSEVTEEELKDWRRHESTKRRVSYPKMTVAKQ
jgi:hypothetical protein